MKAILSESCAGVWLQAVQHLLTCQDWEDYNVVLEVGCPMRRDRRIEDAMDVFLRTAGEQPLVTVAETIFPAAEYRRRGSAGVYE